MSRFCEYELRGWDAEGKPLSDDLIDTIFELLDEIGTEDCSSEPVTEDSYITTFQTEAQGASGAVAKMLKTFSATTPGILLELEYQCRDEDIFSRTRYKNGESEAVDAIITFPPFQRLLLPTPAWILTDSDTGQHVRPLGNRCFECIDMAMTRSGTCYVARRTIDLNDYDLDEDFCQTYLQSYGYENVTAVQTEYGDAADQIIVECIFEAEMWEQNNIVYASTEEACRAYIQATVDSNRP